MTLKQLQDKEDSNRSSSSKVVPIQPSPIQTHPSFILPSPQPNTSSPPVNNNTNVNSAEGQQSSQAVPLTNQVSTSVVNPNLAALDVQGEYVGELAERNGLCPDKADQRIADLRHFLYNAPRLMAPSKHGDIRRHRLSQDPNGEAISCVFWNNQYLITGTDICRIVNYRLKCRGITVNRPKKMEEGVFSDLRQLQINRDCQLEEPRSELLNYLYENKAIRTQKKQKVFYWYKVPHDSLFTDALQREITRITQLDGNTALLTQSLLLLSQQQQQQQYLMLNSPLYAPQNPAAMVMSPHIIPSSIQQQQQQAMMLRMMQQQQQSTMNNVDPMLTSPSTNNTKMMVRHNMSDIDPFFQPHPHQSHSSNNENYGEDDEFAGKRQKTSSGEIDTIGTEVISKMLEEDDLLNQFLCVDRIMDPSNASDMLIPY